MVKYRVTNYGNTRTFPWNGMFIELVKNASVDLEDKDMADALALYPYIDSVSIRVADEAPKSEATPAPTPRKKPLVAVKLFVKVPDKQVSRPGRVFKPLDS